MVESALSIPKALGRRDWREGELSPGRKQVEEFDGAGMRPAGGDGRGRDVESPVNFWRWN